MNKRFKESKKVLVFLFVLVFSLASFWGCDGLNLSKKDNGGDMPAAEGTPGGGEEEQPGNTVSTENRGILKGVLNTEGITTDNLSVLSLFKKSANDNNRVELVDLEGGEVAEVSCSLDPNLQFTCSNVPVNLDLQILAHLGNIRLMAITRIPEGTTKHDEGEVDIFKTLIAAKVKKIIKRALLSEEFGSLTGTDPTELARLFLTAMKNLALDRETLPAILGETSLKQVVDSSRDEDYLEERFDTLARGSELENTVKTKEEEINNNSLSGSGLAIVSENKAETQTIKAVLQDSSFSAEEVLDDQSLEGAVYTQDTPSETDDSLVTSEGEESGGSNFSFAWGRKIENVSEPKIELSIVGNTTHMAVRRTRAGTLYVDNSDDGEKNPFSKVFTHLTTRKLYFEKDFERGWQIKKSSALDITLAEPVIEIKGIKVFRESELIYELGSSSDLFDLPEDLLVLEPGKEIRVETEIVLETSYFVFLHHDKKRDRMFDDGTHGDRTVGDGIFTRTYTIGSKIGRHHATLDVIEAQSFTEEGAYNAQGWRIPYLVGKRVEGSMKRLEIEGSRAGCWVLETEEGVRYQLIEAGHRLFREGLKLIVWGKERPELTTSCQSGTVLEVLKFRIQAEDQLVRLKGRIKHLNLEGDCWVIVTAAAKEHKKNNLQEKRYFQLSGGDEGLYQEGLKTIVWGSFLQTRVQGCGVRSNLSFEVERYEVRFDNPKTHYNYPLEMHWGFINGLAADPQGDLFLPMNGSIEISDDNPETQEGIHLISALLFEHEGSYEEGGKDEVFIKYDLAPRIEWRSSSTIHWDGIAVRLWWQKGTNPRVKIKTDQWEKEISAEELTSLKEIIDLGEKGQQLEIGKFFTLSYKIYDLRMTWGYEQKTDNLFTPRPLGMKTNWTGELSLEKGANIKLIRPVRFEIKDKIVSYKPLAGSIAWNSQTGWGRDGLELNFIVPQEIKRAKVTVYFKEWDQKMIFRLPARFRAVQLKKERDKKGNTLRFNLHWCWFKQG